MICASCCLCGRNEEARLIKKEGPWDIVQCKSCDHVYLYPFPDDVFLKKHYQTYLPFGQNQIEEWRFMMSAVFRRSLRLIDKAYNHQKGKLLDLGCGYGFFLQMEQEDGWEVCGIDLCQPAVEYANSQGLNVSTGGLFEKAYRDGEFDVVTMFYVLEHLPNPMQYLKEVCRILKPGGVLLLRLPHTTPLVRVLKALNISNNLYDTPSHLSDFSPSSIKKFLQNSGFTNIHTCIGGSTFPSPFYKMVITVISGYFAEFLYLISFGKYLLPGVSKTTIAQKL